MNLLTSYGGDDDDEMIVTTAELRDSAIGQTFNDSLFPWSVKDLETAEHKKLSTDSIQIISILFFPPRISFSSTISAKIRDALSIPNSNPSHALSIYIQT